MYYVGDNTGERVNYYFPVLLPENALEGRFFLGFAGKS